MNASQIYITISIIALAVVALLTLLMYKNGRVHRISPTGGLAFAFIVAGIVFGENRVIGYSLLGIGLILAVADMFRLSKQKRK